MTAERLEPLLCPSCRGAVPLADGDTAVCPYCSAAVPIPPDHRALRDGARADTEAEARAAALFRAVGRPPSRVARLLIGSLGWIAALTGAIIPLGVVAGVWFIEHGGRLFGVQLYDVLSKRQQDFLGFIAPFALFAVGFLLIGAARRHAIEMGRLKAALAARPPARPGGTATCRECGAALEHGPVALGARCVYCGTENLVRIPPEYLDRMRRHVRDVRHELKDASKALSGERRRYRWSLFWRLLLGATLVGTPTCLWAMVGPHGVSGLDGYDEPPAGATPIWSEAIAGRPATPSPCQGELFDAQALIALPAGCTASGCPEHRLVAMRRGDRVRIATATVEGNRSVALPDGTAVTIDRHVESWLSDDNIYAPDWGEQVATLHLGAGHPAEFRAPLSGWYRVGVSAPASPPGQWYAFCLEVHPR